MGVSVNNEPPFYGCTPNDGLHVLKDKWCQKSYLKVQSEALIDSLDAALAATFSAAPARSVEQTYRLRHCEHARLKPEEMGVSRKDPDLPIRPSKELLLENAIWERWRLDSKAPTISGLWRTIVTRQVPLFDKQEREHWGHIDLLALSDAGQVVVVELKKATSTECPLRPLIQSVSYAVALRKGWRVFSAELATVLKEDAGIVCGLDSEITPVLLLAPQQYWESWAPDGRLGSTLKSADWDALSRLMDEFGSRGYPVSMASIGGRLPLAPEDKCADALRITEFHDLPPRPLT